MYATFACKGISISIDIDQVKTDFELNQYLDQVFPRKNGELLYISIKNKQYPFLAEKVSRYSMGQQLINLSRFFSHVVEATPFYENIEIEIGDSINWAGAQNLNIFDLWDLYKTNEIRYKKPVLYTLIHLRKSILSNTIPDLTLIKLVRGYKWLDHIQDAEKRISNILKSYVGKTDKKDKITKKYCLCDGYLFSLDEIVRYQMGFKD